MVNLYDIAYWLGLVLGSPYWLLKASARRKVFGAFAHRMGRVGVRESGGPAVLIHAVSLGEMNATRGLVERLRELRPDVHLVVSATTETGFSRAHELYGKMADVVTVIRYPLDFSVAVSRVLEGLRPACVVLMELEIWPNFLRQCAKRGIPVVVVNGRMTMPSFGRYRMIKPVVARMMKRMAMLCVQDEANADRFAGLGASRERIAITGTMKFDTATVGDAVSGDRELAAAVGLRPGQEAIWVCGSTGPGEERMILEVYRRLVGEVDGKLRLVIVPRHPQRFDEVEGLIRSFDGSLGVVRRSRTGSRGVAGGMVGGGWPAVVLGDTVGELRKFYSLATVVFVGRSLVDLGPRQHGSDMIEPAALGKPVIVGPYTGNFSDAMSRFRLANAIVEVGTAEGLGQAVAKLLRAPEEAGRMGRRAQHVVVSEKGATERHARVVLAQLARGEINLGARTVLIER